MQSNLLESLFGRVAPHAVGLLGRLPAPEFLGTPLPRVVAKEIAPVLMVGGWGTMPHVWDVWVRSMERDGIPVLVTEPERYGFGDTLDAAKGLARSAAEVMREFDCETVNVIGHSRGGLVARACAKLLGGNEWIDHVITIATPHSGIHYGSLPNRLIGHPGLDRFAPVSRRDLVRDNEFLLRLKKGELLPGPTRYTSIFSREFDGTVFPVDSPRLPGARNVVVSIGRQRVPLIGHIQIMRSSHAAYDAAVDALLDPVVRDADDSPGGPAADPNARERAS